MATFELLLSQARRHCLAKPSYHFYAFLRFPSQFPHSRPASEFLGFHRSLCSSSSSSSSSSPEPSSPAETRSSEQTGRPQPPSIQTISYPVKPKDPSPSQEDPPQSTPLPRRAREPNPILDKPINAEGRAWTREDIQYVKDVPRISPVSYPSRVAPLPEDRLAAPEEGEVKEEEGAKGDEKKDADEQLERERKRIEYDTQKPRWGFRVEEETVPFPTLIKQQHKKEKVIYDLQEAIRLVKGDVNINLQLYSFNRWAKNKANVQVVPNVHRRASRVVEI